MAEINEKLYSLIFKFVQGSESAEYQLEQITKMEEDMPSEEDRRNISIWKAFFIKIKIEELIANVYQRIETKSFGFENIFKYFEDVFSRDMATITKIVFDLQEIFEKEEKLYDAYRSLRLDVVGIWNKYFELKNKMRLKGEIRDDVIILGSRNIIETKALRFKQKGDRPNGEVLEIKIGTEDSTINDRSIKTINSILYCCPRQ
jgi:hypothetical protein